ncbi:MAG: MXAN_5808 family serine peptidase [Myxococcales bacterium]
MSLSNRPRSFLPFRVIAVVVLLLLWGFAASDRLPPSINSAAHAAEADLQKGGKDKSDHDLSALRVFNRVVLLIKDNYYDPKRIQPRKMLVQALDNVERQVAEIMVDGDEKSPKLKVTVNKVSKEFDISGVDTFWRMSFALKDVFDFVNKNLSAQSKEDSRDIEYAAVNGMLSTLDPHSILLKPDYFKEMKLQTKGEFGGLGFIIQMKEGNLTVVRVLKGTPAQRAGIKSKDVIQRIGNESTVNMDLNDAVDRLRGKPGSDVSLTVLRPSWTAPKQMTLTRAVINVESVEAKLLDNNVGYIKLKGFQGNTARDLHAELKRLKTEAQQSSKDPQKPGLKGVVLDLRGNPGGLLEQAIQVSDAFVSEGTVVTTVGYSDKMREVKKAHADDTDTNLPLVVIVNSGSASASEIVAGALKNLNRGVVVGRQSFGKGSVQVLYDFPDESALKLTIAQYLTPGDVSIQEVGITPDIELVPSRANKDRVDLFAPRKTMGEADLSGHFGNPNSDKVASKREEIAPKDKPLEELRFLRDEPPPPKDAKAAAEKKEKQPDRDDYEADDIEGEDPDTDEIVEDYQIRFARDLILAAPASTRDAMLRAAKPFIAGRRAEEAVRIEKAVEALGLDWNAAPAAAPRPTVPRLVYDMKPAAGQRINAGETLAWTVTVENAGMAAVHRLHAWSESENPYLDRREFLFGALAPGEKKTWTVNVKLAKEMVSRRDDVTLKFFDDEGDKLEEHKGEVNVVELPRPLFAYSWQIVDKCEGCNGDGLAQPGETVELAVEVKNVGAGKAYDLLGSLKNKGDEKILAVQGSLQDGRGAARADQVRDLRVPGDARLQGAGGSAAADPGRRGDRRVRDREDQPAGLHAQGAGQARPDRHPRQRRPAGLLGGLGAERRHRQRQEGHGARQRRQVRQPVPHPPGQPPGLRGRAAGQGGQGRRGEGAGRRRHRDAQRAEDHAQHRHLGGRHRDRRGEVHPHRQRGGQDRAARPVRLRQRAEGLLRGGQDAGREHQLLGRPAAEGGQQLHRGRGPGGPGLHGAQAAHHPPAWWRRSEDQGGGAQARRPQPGRQGARRPSPALGPRGWGHAGPSAPAVGGAPTLSESSGPPDRNGWAGLSFQAFASGAPPFRFCKAEFQP